MSVNMDLQGREYDEAIPEIRCRADMAGAEVFDIHIAGACIQILAYTEDQANRHAWNIIDSHDDAMDALNEALQEESDVESTASTEEVHGSPQHDKNGQNHPQDLWDVGDGEQKIQSQQNENKQNN